VLKYWSGVTTCFFGFLILILLTTCTFPQAEQHKHQREVLKMGLLPYLTPQTLKQKFAPLKKYLEQELDCQIDMYVPASYEELSDRSKMGEFHLTWYATALYAVDPEYNQEALVFPIKKHQEAYRGVIIVRKDSAHQSFSELKNKVFAYPDKYSSSGYIYPRIMLMREGFNPDTFFQTTLFLQNHERVLQAVLQGEADAGAITIDLLQDLSDAERDQIHILAQTEPIPYEPILVTTTLSEPLKKKIKQLFLGLTPQNPEYKKILEALGMDITGFSEVQPTTYQKVAEDMAFHAAKARQMKPLSSERVLLFARIRYKHPRDIQEEFIPLMQYLKETLNIKAVKILVSKDYSEITEWLRNGKIDAAWYGTLTYVIAQKKYPQEILPIVQPLRNGQSSYQGVLISHRDNSVQTLQNFKHQGFFLSSDRTSASSYLYPRLLFLRQNINPDQDLKIINGRHDNIVQNVIDCFPDKICGGATNTMVMDQRGEQERRLLREIAVTPPIPEPPIAVSQDLDSELSQALQTALLNLSHNTPDTQAIRKSLDITGFQKCGPKQPCNEAMFEPVYRDILEHDHKTQYSDKKIMLGEFEGE